MLACAQDSGGADSAAKSSTSAVVVSDLVITARRKERTTKIDRTVYDVRANAETRTSRAIDVIGKLPSVFVGPKNRITMQGGVNVTLMLDGKVVPRDVALQVPADQIDSIEVITNPSAAFDSSDGPIINIVLKKVPKSPWKGEFAAADNTLNTYNTSVSLTRGWDKWKFNTYLSLTDERGKAHIATDRNYDPSDGLSYDDSHRSEASRTTTDKALGSLKLARDLDSDASVTLSSVLFSTRTVVNGGYDTLFGTGGPNATNATYHGRDKTDNFHSTLSYSAKRESDYSLELYSSVSLTHVDSGGAFHEDGLLQSSAEVNENDHFDVSADYQKQYGDNQLSAGLVFTTVHSTYADSDYGYVAEGELQVDRFTAQEYDYAAYITYQINFDGYGVMPGLRSELTDLSMKNASGPIAGVAGYNRVLPSLNLQKTVGEHNIFRASYSERTTPFTIQQLNPFVRYYGPENATQGNPSLRPAYGENFELGHEYNAETYSIVSTLYYRDTKNDINTYLFLGPNGVLISTPINLGRSRSVGIETVWKHSVGKRIDITLDFDVFSREIVAPDALRQFATERHPGINSKVSFEYKIGKDDKLTSNISYQGKTYGLGSETSGLWTTDITWSHTVSKRLSFVLDLVDFGGTRDQLVQSDGPGYRQIARTRSPVQAIRLGLSRSF